MEHALLPPLDPPLQLLTIGVVVAIWFGNAAQQLSNTSHRRNHELKSGRLEDLTLESVHSGRIETVLSVQVISVCTMRRL